MIPVHKTDRERFKKVWLSKEWSLIRSIRLQLNPICQICESKGLTEPATQVDHIIPLALPEGWAKRYDLQGTQSLCSVCHGHKSNVQDRVLREKGISIDDTMNQLESFD